MPTAPPGLTWLASYPKSGNTWMRILLSGLLAGVPQDINDLHLQDGIASDRKTFDDLTLLDSRMLRMEEIEDLRPAVHDAFAAALKQGAFVKTHDAYSRLKEETPLLGRGARAAVYLVRDPRDVAISFSHHLHCPLDAAISRLNDPGDIFQGGVAQTRQRLNGWSRHVRSWLEQEDIPVHVVRYEDLLADTPAVFRDVLDFLGIAATPEEAAHAARLADFGELQRQERASGFRERVADEGLFFRQGRAGDWRGKLDTTQVAAIEAAHGGTMERLGYRREMTA